jgi:hypothetical protein
MKPTDLQIGDYVKYLGNVYIVEEISAKGWVHLIYPKTKARLNLASDYIINLLEPIPLTAEILERNGFLLKGKKGKKDISDSAYKQWSFIKSTSRITVTFFQNLWMIDVRNNGKVKSKPIRMVNYLIDGNRAYLHDLQHALRSGGLSDLADKLKMEE